MSSIYDIFREMGRSGAQTLRREAAGLTGTQIIDRAHAVPAFDPAKDYSGWPAGAPVQDEGQIWLLLQPHNAAHYPGLRPSTNRACWGIAHTVVPERARPWVDPLGTSGVYMAGECYRAKDGTVKRALRDYLVHDAEAYPEGWETVLQAAQEKEEA